MTPPTPVALRRPAARAALLALVLAGAVLAGAGPALADPVATCSVPGAVTAHPGRTQLIYAGCTPNTAVPAAVAIDPPAHGTVAALSNLTFQYVADDAYTGPAAFTVHPSGADGQAWPAFTVAIDVTASGNTPPNCGYGSGGVITRQEQPVVVPINACIDAEGDPLTVAITTAPAHGAFTAVRPAAIGGGYELTYTPEPGFSGADTIGYAATDDHGDRSAEATVGVDVHPLGTNQPPICPPQPTFPGMTPPTADATVFLGQNTVYLGCRDPDGDPITLTFVTPPAHGTVVSGPDPSRPTFTYTAIGGYTGPDALVVDLSDGQGGTLRKAMTLHVGNHWAECGPRVEATIAGRATAADPGATVRRPCNDPDGDPLTATLWTPPVHGSVRFDDAAGTLTYTPDVGFTGDDLVGFDVDDGHYGINYGQVLFHVGPAAAPSAVTRASSPSAGKSAAAKDPVATRAAALLGGPAVAFDLGLGTAARGFATAAKTVANGRALAVVVCARACTLGVDGRLELNGEKPTARARGSLRLVHRTLKAKAGGAAVIRLALTKAQRSRVAHAKRATVTLALTTRAGQKARSVHRAFTIRR